MDELRRQVRDTLGGWLGQQGGALLLGLSGGMDSMVLLHLLAELREELGFTLSAATVDHGMREFRREVELTQSTCRRLSVPWVLLSLEAGLVDRAKRAGRSMEEQARLERYRVLHERRRLLDASYLVLAHHGGDQAETLLMRLGRGTGLWGLAGMREATEGRVLRPLLMATSSRMRRYADTVGLTWVDDPTNSHLDILRNRVRREVMPLVEAVFPAASENLARSARVIADELDALEFLVDARLSQAVESLRQDEESGCVECRLKASDLGEGAVRRLLLHRMFLRLGLYAPGADHLEALDRLMDSNKGSATRKLPDGVVAVREYETLVLRIGGDSGEVPWEPMDVRVPGVTLFPGGRIHCDFFAATAVYKGDNDTMLLSAGPVARGLILRPWAVGDRIDLPGGDGTRKVSDVLGEARIPRDRRRAWPMLVDGEGKILWAVGLRRSGAEQPTPAGAVWLVRVEWA